MRAQCSAKDGETAVQSGRCARMAPYESRSQGHHEDADVDWGRWRTCSVCRSLDGHAWGHGSCMPTPQAHADIFTVSP